MSDSNRRSNLAAGRLVVGIVVALAMSHGVAIAQLKPCPNTDPVSPYACYNQQELWDALLARKPKPYEPNCQSPQGRDDADLCAQRRMAEAAEELTALTLGQLFIGGLGLLAVAASLLISAKATKAAESQVRLSREAMVHTQRAFVFVKRLIFSAVVHPDKEEDVTGWMVAVEWENSGETPTKRLLIRLNMSIGASLPDDFDFPDYGKGQTPTLIGPKARLASTALPVTLDQMKAVAAGVLNWYVWGWASRTPPAIAPSSAGKFPLGATLPLGK
jgi:hypothetical protein